VVAYCKLMGDVKDGEFVDQLKDSQLLKGSSRNASYFKIVYNAITRTSFMKIDTI
jgi:hypothetical protein